MSFRTVRALTSSRSASSEPVQSRGVWSSESRRSSRDDVDIATTIGAIRNGPDLINAETGLAHTNPSSEVLLMSSPATQAWGGVDRPPIELPHPVRMRVLGAVMVAVFLSALDQTVVGTALPTIITDLGGNGLYTWAITAYLLTATISGPALRKDLRPVRSAAGLPVRHQRVHAGLRARGPVTADVAAGCRPWDPGPRRGRDLPPRDGDDRRPILAVRARPVPGAVRGGVRALEPPRPRDRRAHHRHHRLAVRVLRQHPDRPRRAVHDPPLPARIPTRRRASEDRLPRRRPVHRRARAD